jgi:hypothetical protein
MSICLNQSSTVGGVKALLVVPGNRSHAASLLPVADELKRRGHQAEFLIRDAYIEVANLRVADLIDKEQYPVHVYDGEYQTDINQALPYLGSYFRSQKAVGKFLAARDYNLVALCNDDSALFDRLLIDWSVRRRKEVLLIQESIRPARRRLPLGARLQSEGVRKLVLTALLGVAGSVCSSPYFRKGYGHSACTMIATAGDRYRRQLLGEGVPAAKLRVTGQPRLDTPPNLSTGFVVTRKRGEPATLLYCNQPLNEAQPYLPQLLRDLAVECQALDQVRLVFKLHPEDGPAGPWREALPIPELRRVVEVVDNRRLDDCFREADAMMTIASTTSVEAMARGLPVGLINYLPVPWHLPFEQCGAALSVTTRAQLRASIQELLYNAELRRRLVSNADQVFMDELYLQDGGSAGRIVDFMEEQLGLGLPNPLLNNAV